MGIPSYFSHIIRNYSNIIRNLKYFDENQQAFQHLFMDCNSIIYDAVRLIEYKQDDESFEQEVINNVIVQIEKYIEIIKPTKTVYIAFDGVAPLAKMEQQRTRRHKTHFMAQVNFNNINDTPKWNTSAITPGTNFMNKLSDQLKYAFSYLENKYNVKSIITSPSDEPGEGEHKLFDFLRNNDFTNDSVALYGLDADLIMLSIFHLNYCKDIFVFREAPEFIKNSLPVNVKTNDDMPYFLDIRCLSRYIVSEMHCADNHINRAYDYVFLCFFLGNDFLPHFPAMNIRTHGIDTLLTIYSKTVGKMPNNYIINLNGNINWKNVRKVISEIANNEHTYLTQELGKRKRFDSYKYPETTVEEKETLFSNTPVIYRTQELYISPENSHWQQRYYKSLFKKEYSREFVKEVSNNYLEALEWVFKYYSKGCIHWRWKYNYSYPPLFEDLIKFIPHFETEFVKPSDSEPYLSSTQLSYVLPMHNHSLLLDNIRKFLNKNYKELYADKYRFEWAFCRYFWESHPLLPEINVDLLNQWNTQFMLLE